MTNSETHLRKNSRCSSCGKPFTPLEWVTRHSDFDGEDVHNACCEHDGPCSIGPDWRCRSSAALTNLLCTDLSDAARDAIEAELNDRQAT